MSTQNNPLTPEEFEKLERYWGPGFGAPSRPAIENALALAAKGYRVFPLKPKEKVPAITEWQLRASSDPEAVRAMFDRDDHNIGIACGEIVPLDADGEEGLESAKRLQLPADIPTVGTPTRGEHYLMRALPGKRYGNRTRVLPGLDVRGDGGYIVAMGTAAWSRKPNKTPVFGWYVGKNITELPNLADIPLMPANVDTLLGGEDSSISTTALPKTWMAGTCGDWKAKISEKLWDKIKVEGEDRSKHSFAVMAELIKLGLTDDDIEEACHETEAVFATKFLERGITELRTEIARVRRNKTKIAGRGFTKGEVLAPGDNQAGQVSRHLEWPATNKDGKPLANHKDNVAALLTAYNVELRRNIFAEVYETRSGGDWVELTDAHLNALWAAGCQHGLSYAFDGFVRLVSVLADVQRFHPVLSYLESLKWDGTPRLETFALRYLGAKDSPLNRAFGRLTLIGACRRVLTPGAKHDSMLVLESDQGKDKSSCLAILGGQHFSDNLKLGTEAREVIEQSKGSWIIEVAELAGMAVREIEAIKAQISRQVDRARAAFGRLTQSVPRQFVLIGTTNSRKYLRDATGNRRFWPMKVGKIDLQALAADRDQLWAEAFHMAKAGESSALPEALWELAGEAQEERRMMDAIEEKLRIEFDGDFAAGRISKNQLWKMFAGDARPPTTKESQTILETMAKLGWTDRRASRFGKRPYIFERIVPGQEPKWFYWKEENGFGRLAVSVD